VFVPTNHMLAKLPTVVKLEYKPFELNVLPTNAFAFTLDAATPVTLLPLPTN